jgi:hypothetical protein
VSAVFSGAVLHLDSQISRLELKAHLERPVVSVPNDYLPILIWSYYGIEGDEIDARRAQWVVRRFSR